MFRLVAFIEQKENDKYYIVTVSFTDRLDSLKTFPGTCKRKFPSNRSCAIIQTNLKCQSCIHLWKVSAKKACVKIHIVSHAIKI